MRTVRRPAETVRRGLARASAVHDGVVLLRRAYRLTPSRLRRPEPAIRAAVTAAAVWFGGLFFALAALMAQTPGPAGDVRVLTVAGYVAAGTLGVGGVALFWTRRVRPAVAALASMLVLGQLVTVFALV
jgi:hypothetical protein